MLRRTRNEVILIRIVFRILDAMAIAEKIGDITLCDLNVSKGFQGHIGKIILSRDATRRRERDEDRLVHIGKQKGTDALQCPDDRKALLTDVDSLPQRVSFSEEIPGRLVADHGGMPCGLPLPAARHNLL